MDVDECFTVAQSKARPNPIEHLSCYGNIGLIRPFRLCHVDVLLLLVQMSILLNIMLHYFIAF